MHSDDLEKIILESMKEIKGELPNYSIDKSLSLELGFESIETIDLIFVLQKKISAAIDLNELASRIVNVSGRRFGEMTTKDLIEYVQSKQ
jgi:acyl carrier protein